MSKRPRPRTTRRKVARKIARKAAPSRKARKLTKSRKASKSARAAKAPRTQKAPEGSGIAPGMQAVNTYLAVANVRASMAFLEQSIGFTPTLTLPDADAQPRYAEMRKGNTVIMLVRKGDATAPGGGAAALYAYVDDLDSTLVRARNAGAGCGVPEDTPWGDRAVSVTDPDGYRWVLATFKKLVPFAAPPSSEPSE
jgi:uncharacterized glyoxalase superfamily protein PhnB